MKSPVAVAAEQAQREAVRRLTPEQRLQAFRRLCEQVEALRRAGAAARAARRRHDTP